MDRKSVSSVIHHGDTGFLSTHETLCLLVGQIVSHMTPEGPEGSRKLTKMSGYKITYFPIRGRVEPIRLLLADQGASWTEDEVQFPDWFSGKYGLKKTAVFGQLPRFQHGDFVLYQSSSILRYLGREHGISGSNNQESALIDMVNDGLEDLRTKYGNLILKEYETGKEKYIKDLPNQLSPFERILSNNSNGTKFVVGNKISYADYNLLDILHCHLDLDPKCLATFPLLAAYVERIASQPKLSQYLKSEARNKRPITPKHK